MTAATRLLVLMMAVRLLAPPGVCLCKLSAPAVAYLSNTSVPDEPEDADDDHDPGCPCSPLSAAMGLRPPCELAPLPVLSLDEVAAISAETNDLKALVRKPEIAHFLYPSLFDDFCLLQI